MSDSINYKCLYLSTENCIHLYNDKEIFFVVFFFR